jgi:hypothetical protein
MCNLSHASEIILVAGGIGITPILSLMRQLCHIYTIRSSSGRSTSHNLPQLPPITVVWSLRQSFLLSVFREQLLEVLRSHLSLITIKIYFTSSKIVLPPEVPLEIKSVINFGSRPDVVGIFSTVKERSLHRDIKPSSVHAIACGPVPLTLTVQNCWCVPTLLTLSFSSSLTRGLPHPIQPQQWLYIFQRRLLFLIILIKTLHTFCDPLEWYVNLEFLRIKPPICFRGIPASNAVCCLVGSRRTSCRRPKCQRHY